MAIETTRRPFSVRDYHRMVDAGILAESDRVELIRGDVLAMSPIGPPHDDEVLRAINALVPIFQGVALVGCQGAVRLSDYDEPQPDIYLLRPRADTYTTEHAGPGDIFLIIEVGDSSIEFDRTVKASLYAETGVREYWVADLPGDCVWTYTDIRDRAYRSLRQFRRGDSVSPQSLPGYPIPMDVLLP